MLPLLLYSTNTLLAYTINERYYKDIHYVWCTPYFKLDPNSPFYTVAASSSPSDIYNDLQNAIATGDLNNSKIRDNRIGIINGATIMRQKNKITLKQYKEITSLVQAAQMNAFRPLLYIIPHDKVKNLVKPAPLARKANPLSQEFIIARLPRKYFGIIQF